MAAPTPRSVAKRPATSDVALASKRPNLGRSVYRQTILSEDDYTEAIERIVRRDFFPDLYAADLERERQEREAERVAHWTSAASARGNQTRQTPLLETPATYRGRLQATPSVRGMAYEGNDTPMTYASTSATPYPDAAAQSARRKEKEP